ncbi:MAG: hypothetical protein MZV64_67770 [Ignavibacteriales bacterium]|nr:hypothetical protein [Ignavibacteriales bacterium]
MPYLHRKIPVKMVAQYLRAGQFVSLESSTYPGTTEEILLPMFENAPIYTQFGSQQISSLQKLKTFVVGKDFFLAFSPEREDPSNPNYSTATIH